MHLLSLYSMCVSVLSYPGTSRCVCMCVRAHVREHVPRHTHMRGRFVCMDLHVQPAHAIIS